LLVLMTLSVSPSSAFFTYGTMDSYAQYPRWQPCLGGSISFEFLSDVRNGLLFYTDDGGQNDFFELRLENRKLMLRFRLNKLGMGKIDTSDYKDLDDDQWHKVKITRYHKWTYLYLDDFPAKSAEVPGYFDGMDQLLQFGSLERNNFVFLGGMPAIYRNPAHLQYLSHPSIMFDKRWRGQMRNLQYSNCSCPLRSAKIMKLIGGFRNNRCETNNPCVKKNPNCDCLIDASGKPQCDCKDKPCRSEEKACTMLVPFAEYSLCDFRTGFRYGCHPSTSTCWRTCDKENDKLSGSNGWCYTMFSTIHMSYMHCRKDEDCLVATFRPCIDHHCKYSKEYLN